MRPIAYIAGLALILDGGPVQALIVAAILTIGTILARRIHRQPPSHGAPTP